METKELEGILIKAFRASGGSRYSFEHSRGGDRETIAFSFSLAKEDAVQFYKKLNNINLYGVGWLMHPLISDEMGEKYKIDFEKV